ncbi:MAG: tetratricopeptide repeat protein [Thermodesulfobacteriota bacterium]
MTSNLFRAWLLFFPFFLLAMPLNGCGRLPRIIVVKDPLTVEEHLKLGVIYESRGETGLAIKEYKRALSIGRGNPDALFFLGNAYFSKNELKKAGSFYKKALDKAGRDFQKKGLLNNNLAWVYIREGSRLEEAERLSKEAIELDATNSPIYLDTLGVIYTAMREYALAEQVLLESIRKAPTEDHLLLSEALMHLSEVYKALGLDDKAIEAIKKADEHRQDNKD